MNKMLYTLSDRYGNLWTGELKMKEPVEEMITEAILTKLPELRDESFLMVAVKFGGHEELDYNLNETE